jgi:hypothetical protein
MSDQFEVIIVEDPQTIVVQVETLVSPDIEVQISPDPTALVVQVDNGIAGTPGAPGPNLIDATTSTTLNGILKGNGATVGTAVPDVDYATVPLTIVNALIFG